MQDFEEALVFFPSFGSVSNPCLFPKLLPHATVPKLCASKKKKHRRQECP